jgi:hypothetical protein
MIFLYPSLCFIRSRPLQLADSHRNPCGIRRTLRIFLREHFRFGKTQENLAFFAAQLDGRDHIRTHNAAQTRNEEDQKTDVGK